MQAADVGRKRGKVFGVDRRLLLGVGGKILARDGLVGAAIAVIHHEHLVDLAQVDRDLRVVAERLAPFAELVGERTKRCPGQHDRVVPVGHATPAHGSDEVVGRAEIHAAEKQGFRCQRACQHRPDHLVQPDGAAEHPELQEVAPPGGRGRSAEIVSSPCDVTLDCPPFLTSFAALCPSLPGYADPTPRSDR
ncbi:hypothetical protein [Sagittula salina]|uniref:Uncharacterized protein n=1 Tax=Sagittula salina TaxID=2820268 RepID=A0A940MPW6_9RHOB|nr:hypothetical protein [Sagittula salina]MBP0480899.1 hypothetical protein [Sagittula salina]